MTKTKAMLPLICILLAAVSLGGYSQIRETGTIQGRVTDEDNFPLPGVSVTIEGPRLIGGPRAMATSTEGFFRFPALLPGEYRLKAELLGFNTRIREGVYVHAGMTITVDFQLHPSALEKEVIVEAASPLIDVTSSSARGTYISDLALKSLPVDFRQFWSVINMSPGVMDNIAYGSQSGGSSWHIDGVEMSDPRQGEIWGYNPDFNIIEEFTIQGLGLPAEYGEFTGAYVNVITKSGANRFSGQVELNYNGKNWNSQNRHKIPAEEWTFPTLVAQDVFFSENLNVGAQAGGKIIHDRLWYFVSGSLLMTERTTDVATGRADQSGTYRAFLKPTYQLNLSNRLVGSVNFNYTYSENPMAMLGVVLPPGIGQDVKTPAMNLNLNWTSTLTPNSILESKIGYNYQNRISDPQAGRDIPGRRDLFLDTYVDNWPAFRERAYGSFQLKSHYNAHITDFLGSHNFKAGAELIANTTENIEGYPGNVRYEDWDGEPYRKYEKATQVHDHHFRTIVGFVQDSWTPVKNITLNLGVRYNHYHYRIPNPDGGRGILYQSHSLSPRIGMVADVFGDRKTIFKLHYGIYGEALLDSFFQGLESRYPIENIYEWDGTEYRLIQSVSTNPFSEIVLIDPDIRQPYLTEYIIGLERELFKDASLTLSFFYRNLGRTIGGIDIGTQWREILVTNPGPDGVVGTEDDRGQFVAYDAVRLGQEVFFITNPQKGISDIMLEDPRREVRGFEIVFTKRFSNRWQAMASYNYSIAHGNALSSLFSPVSPNYFVRPYGEGRMGFNYPSHMVKLQGTYMLPLDIGLGLMCNINSGYPVYPDFAYSLPVSGIWYFNGGFIGEFHTDPNVTLSARLEKSFDVMDKMKLSYVLDVTNIFNTPYPTSKRYRFGPIFDRVSGCATPRSFRASIRLAF